MGPEVIKKPRPHDKVCTSCKHARNGDEYVRVKSWVFPDGLAPICNDCLKSHMVEDGWTWSTIDKLCQTFDIPFLPKEFERLHDINGDDVFPVYAQILQEEPYELFGWQEYFEKFKELRRHLLLEHELPIINDARIEQLGQEWGKNYDEEELMYLEDLYNGMLATQNINGALQIDQARKMCKISLSIDTSIREGENIDKLMGSYDKLAKTADFTPKNVKSENNFDSFGEVAAWLERRGWVNTYFDGVTKDVVDEVIHNLQAFNQRLYTNESGIGEAVTDRLEMLQAAKNIESNYDIEDLGDFDNYDNTGYSDLLKEEFIIDDEI